MLPASQSECLLPNLQLGDGFNPSSETEIANAINSAFLEPMEHYQPLNSVRSVFVSVQPTSVLKN